nr:unnamed protein product [Callosobruchus analis]
MSKRSYNSDLEKEDHVIKRQRKKEKFDKLQREMETLQRKIDLFSSDSSSAEEGDGIRTTTIADVHVEADSLNLVINENEPIIKPALSEITDTLNIGAETTSEEPRDGPTDILRLFGSDPASSNPQGVILFDWMASRLENIVKSGINHEEKQKYLYGENLLEKVKQARETKTVSSRVGIVKRKNPVQRNNLNYRGQINNKPKLNHFENRGRPEERPEASRNLTRSKYAETPFHQNQNRRPYPKQVLRRGKRFQQ